MEGGLHHPCTPAERHHACLRASQTASQPPARPRVPVCIDCDTAELAACRLNRSVARYSGPSHVGLTLIFRRIYLGEPAAESHAGTARLFRGTHLSACRYP